ncbi:hypothetical protein GCM10017600_37060 [Streptosporangium carneum]|uniref:Uncharacterized protein n=1 Tax=Streptosporangium carneum TaxID=47481 RepID=A0A9W6MDU8_9ACTN|nr:hypothetical protein GCM10017600_37060 [Streptosporangium carneum]
MFSLSSLSFQPVSVPVAKLRAECTDSACGGSTKVALAMAVDPERRSRAASGHQPTGGHQSSAVQEVRESAVWVDCTSIIMVQTPVQVQERMHVHKVCATATVTHEFGNRDRKGILSAARESCAAK